MKTVFSIVGTNFRGSDAQEIVRNLKGGEPLTLKRERDNKYDPMAVAVYSGSVCIGYIPKAKNADIARRLDKEIDDAADNVVAADSADPTAAARDPGTVAGTFNLSPNSAFPQIVVGE